jgi:hypothetical protein
MICLPKLQEIAVEAIDTIFVPKTIARQLTLAIALETGLVSCVKGGKQVQLLANE